VYINKEDMPIMADLQKLADDIQGLTLIEASELVKILEDKLGVTAAAPMALAAALPGAAAPAEEVEEQTEFDVLLQDVGAKKIQVIKVVRQLTNLGLKESKDLVDGAPNAVLQAVSKEVAEDAKSRLEAEGASVQVK
jgi:large subunit ribosomal protein L7/L12